ncbi:MAG: hypothetical protein ACKO1I_08105, partial [Microcystis aeruginosa]
PAGMVVKTNRRIVQNYPLVKVRYGGDRVIGFHRWKKLIVQTYPLVRYGSDRVIGFHRWKEVIVQTYFLVKTGGGNDRGIRSL